MPVPDYANPRPAYMQIADDLRGQIETGKYHPGDRLPSNRLMSEQYGVAAETIRQALDVLRGEGLVATQSTRGTFVLKERGERTSDSGPSAERLDKLESEVADLREGFNLLQAQMMNLYQSRGRQYPHEDDTAEPGRRAR
jgi:DNA-binding GntR family transcriptional regulator